MAIAASAVNFTLSFDQSSDTNPILCDFESIIEAQNAASILQVELEGLASKVSILVNTESTGGDGSDATSVCQLTKKGSVRIGLMGR